MKKTNGKESPVVVKVSGPFIVPRRFTIEQLAQYLGMTNFEAEERLRHGDIKFKWAGSKGKGHKIVEKADADAWANLQPHAEMEANGSPEPLMSDDDIRPFFKGTHHKGNSIEIEIEAEKWKQLGKKTSQALSRGDLEEYEQLRQQAKQAGLKIPD
jgi:hypothetical protein